MNYPQLFTSAGGQFLTPPAELEAAMLNIRGFLFDWDGVFNDSRKTGKNESYFTEVESMGLNMLRFSTWMARQSELPYMGVISGEDNEVAKTFLTREHFDYCCFKAKDKRIALDHFIEKTGLKANEIAFVFDDILDLSVAQRAGVRICVRRKGNPLFLEYVKERKLADYITASECGNFALREGCELMTALNANFEQTLDERISYSETYKSYLEKRAERKPEFFTALNNVLKKLDP